MSAGSIRPTYSPRGLILPTGEDFPFGQNLRASGHPSISPCSELVEIPANNHSEVMLLSQCILEDPQSVEVERLSLIQTILFAVEIGQVVE